MITVGAREGTVLWDAVGREIERLIENGTREDYDLQIEDDVEVAKRTSMTDEKVLGTVSEDDEMTLQTPNTSLEWEIAETEALQSHRPI